MNPHKSISTVICFVILFIRTLCTAAPVPIPVSKVSGGEDYTSLAFRNVNNLIML
jgi:hypothetical protein